MITKKGPPVDLYIFKTSTVFCLLSICISFVSGSGTFACILYLLFRFANRKALNEGVGRPLFFPPQEIRYGE